MKIQRKLRCSHSRCMLELAQPQLRSDRSMQLKANTLPPEVSNACLILGIKPGELEEHLIRTTWKQQAIDKARIGDSESARCLNGAKDTLINWLRSKRIWCTPASVNEASAEDRPYHGEWPPPGPTDPDNPAGVPRRPFPIVGAGEIALPEPGSEP
jgi:hypothetical protein